MYHRTWSMLSYWNRWKDSHWSNCKSCIYWWCVDIKSQKGLKPFLQVHPCDGICRMYIIFRHWNCLRIIRFIWFNYLHWCNCSQYTWRSSYCINNLACTNSKGNVKEKGSSEESWNHWDFWISYMYLFRQNRHPHSEHNDSITYLV